MRYVKVNFKKKYDLDRKKRLAFLTVLAIGKEMKWLNAAFNPNGVFWFLDYKSSLWQNYFAEVNKQNGK